jgi:RimJ/RimL family protein N-acetyltransferase
VSPVILASERLTLREPDDGDVETLRDYHRRNAERFAPWEPPIPDDDAAHRAWIAAAHRERRGGKATTLLAFDVTGGALAAIVALSGFTTEDGGSAMLSYTVDGAFEGRGYASEAVRRTIRYAAEELGVASISAYYEPANARSERLLQRAGFDVVAQTPVVPGLERLMRVRNLAVLRL